MPSQFTDKLIKNLKTRNAPYDLREGSGQGFAIRVMPSGHKSWVFIYHFESKKQRMTLGAYPAISLADARALHRNAIRCLASGKNPTNEQCRKARLSGTVNDLINKYLEKWAKPRKRSWQEDQRMLLKDIAPIWGKRKTKDIKRREVIMILDDICKRGSPIAANRTLAVMRRMFNFAIERDIVESSPCFLVKAPGKENHRDRVLSENEIKALWQGLDATNMSDLIRLAIKIQLATAQRKGEVAAAEWKEIDFEKAIWEIPGSKAKNGNLHRVPLSNLTISLLDELKHISKDSIWLFPSPTGKTHIGGHAIDHALWRSKHIFGDNKPIIPHDLRRTAASYMTTLGIPRLVVSKILNHTENSVTAIYDRHSYDKEKRETLEMWGKKLNEIIFNNTV
jgi:integrase